MKNKFILVLIIVAGFLLRIYTALDYYLHAWDERYHALVAKHLMKHPLIPTLYERTPIEYVYTNWTANHIWLHKQPLSLWVISISLKIFGVNEFAVRLPSILLSTAGIWLTYKICLYFFNHRTALFAAFLYAVNGLIIELTAGRVATDHPDIFLSFFTQAAVYCIIRNIQTKSWLFTILPGICLGMALLSKWLPALIVLPVGCLLMMHEKAFSFRTIAMRLLTICSIATVIFLPWQIYIHHQFPIEAAWERTYNSRHFSEALEGQNGTWHYFLDRMRIDYGELIYIPLIWIIYKWWKIKKDFKIAALICWALVPTVIFSFAATKMQGYILISAPAFFIITAVFFDSLHSYRPSMVYWKIGKQLLLFALVIIPIRYCIERVKPFSKQDRKPLWVTDLKNWKEGQNPDVILFGYKAPIEAMFYTEATVYETVPSAEEVKKLMDKGFQIFINKPPSSTIGFPTGVRFSSLRQPD